MRLPGLAAFYRADEPIVLEAFPPGHSRLEAHNAHGQVYGSAAKPAKLEGLAPGTYRVRSSDAGGAVLAEEITTVGEDQGERPVNGFITSFDGQRVPAITEWLAQLRCTVVQFYDWMAAYAAPLGPPEGWVDPLGRHISLDALRSLAAATRRLGAVAQAYAPVYAVGQDFAHQNPKLLMYRSDGAPQHLFEGLVLANPAEPAWQEHFAASYGRAADAIGFNGFHLDSYGFPRAARSMSGQTVDMRSAYLSFLGYFRTRRPEDLVSFNQVNGVPSGLALPIGPHFRYCEVWPPNGRWAHLEGLLDRSAGSSGRLGPARPGQPVTRGTLACYPPVWGPPATSADDGGAPLAPNWDSLRTVLLTEAVSTMLGASCLLYGDAGGALCDPYYPKHHRLTAEERAAVLRWHHFALAWRDLFLEGEDTSWYDIGDENGAVSVTWAGSVAPEPVAGALFTRVVRHRDVIAIGLLDLSGSEHGSWSEPTQEGHCRAALLTVLLEDPKAWELEASVLGRQRPDFSSLVATTVGHREGLALCAEVPLGQGWSVVRLRRRASR